MEQDLFDLTIQRLNELDRPDGGWFVVTRVHLNVERLSKIVGYMHMTGIGETRNITTADYRTLAKAVAIGAGAEDPGSIIRRHYFLAMETPLRLLQRMDGNRWESVRLSPRGRELALESNKHGVLERILHEIVFCRAPWYTPDRVERYQNFDIRPYPALLRILEQCDGYIDRDEFGLFAYTLRTDAEIDWTIAMIREFRALTQASKEQFLARVRQVFFDRLDGVQGTNTGKAYQNWRDMALHSFAFFSLGTSLLQEGTTLTLTGHYAGGAPLPAPPQPRRTLTLRPLDAATASLNIPPPVQANSGSEAEQFIAKILRAQGWEVVFYSDKRGYGFDLWAKKEGVSILIEVKSSLGQYGTLRLTELEKAAADQYGEWFVVAIVEWFNDNPTVHYISNPAANIQLNPTAVNHYETNRANWLPAAAQSLEVAAAP